MSDTALPTTSKPITSELTEAQYKEMCKAVRHHQLKNGKKKKHKTVLKPVGKVLTVQKTFSVQESSTDWDDIEDEPFTLDINVTQIYVKTGKDRVKCLNNGRSMTIAGAAVYKVFL